MDTQKQAVQPSETNPPVSEEILDEIVDIEAFAHKGKQPPKARGYKIKVNGDEFVFDEACVTGREVLEKAGLTPPENYTLRLKVSGQRPRKVELDEKIDLRHPGVEKFKALPRDQTEGCE